MRIQATKDKYLPERGTIERRLADYVLSGYTEKVMGAVAASCVYHHVVAPVVNVVVDTGGELIKGVVKGMALMDAGLANAANQFGGGPKPTFTPEQQLEHVDQAFEGMGKAVGTVVKPAVELVQSSLEFATGSKSDRLGSQAKTSIVPHLIIPYHTIQVSQELPHAGNDRDLKRLARG